MAGQTFALIDAALKDDYQDRIRDQLNNDVMMVAQLDRSTQRVVGGREVVLTLHVGRNSGVGSRAEGDTLPTAGRQKYRTERVPLKYHFGRIELTGVVIEATKSNKAAFVNAAQAEVEGLIMDLKREYNRMIFNNADGTIAQCSSETGGVVTLNNPTETQLLQLEIGSMIDIGTVTNPTLRGSNLEITAVDETNGTVTVSGTITGTVDTNDYITRAGTGSTTSGATKELTGLQVIVNDTGTLHNVDPTTEPKWKSTVLSNGGTKRAFTDNLVEQAIHDVHLRAGGRSTPKFAVTSYGVLRNFAAQLKAQRRYDASGELKGGFSGLKVGVGDQEIVLTADRDCPNNTCFILNLDHIQQDELQDWQWADQGEGVMKPISGKNAWEAYQFKFSELCTDQRNAHIRIDDLKES